MFKEPFFAKSENLDKIFTEKNQFETANLWEDYGYFNILFPYSENFILRYVKK